MILGIGVDLVEVPRLERVLRTAWAERFLARVFSSEEIRVCRDMAFPAQGYAARFAAKEAVSKALGTGFTRGVAPGLIVVRGGERSRPTIELIQAARSVADSLGVGRIHVTLTHTSAMACAVVVLETE